MNNGAGFSLMGMPVHISPQPMVRPILKVSSTVPMSDEARAAMDAYLLDMFGTEHYMIVLYGKAYMMDATLRDQLMAAAGNPYKAPCT